MSRALFSSERVPMLGGKQAREQFYNVWDRRLDEMLEGLRAVLPEPLWRAWRGPYHLIRSTASKCWGAIRTPIFRMWYRCVGLPNLVGETSKARARRIREGFFERYCHGKGLDIGHNGDPLTPTCRGWEWIHGDAHYLHGLKDNNFDFVYSSHCLEHMDDPALAVRNWWRVVKPGGHLILYIPHRDLVEQRTTLPPKWNPDHKHYFLPDRDEAPVTIGLRPFLERYLAGARVITLKVCDEGYSAPDPNIHPVGEYSIEAIIQKVAL